MGKIILIGVAFAICFWIISLFKSTPKTSESKLKIPRKKPVIQMLNREADWQEDGWHTYIAGLHHHVSKYDIGGFTGWVENDHGNTYDSNAMGVFNSFGKLLGYIPAKELSDYRAWCDAKPQPCVGFVFVEDGQIRGKVKILRPCNEEFLQKGFSSYLQWVNDNFGSEYLPKSMNMTFNTEEQ